MIRCHSIRWHSGRKAGGNLGQKMTSRVGHLDSSFLMNQRRYMWSGRGLHVVQGKDSTWRSFLCRANVDDSDEDLWRIHQELIEQLEERKKAKGRLMSRMNPSGPVDQPESSRPPSKSPPQSKPSPPPRRAQSSPTTAPSSPINPKPSSTASKPSAPSKPPSSPINPQSQTPPTPAPSRTRPDQFSPPSRAGPESTSPRAPDSEGKRPQSSIPERFRRQASSGSQSNDADTSTSSQSTASTTTAPSKPSTSPPEYLTFGRTQRRPSTTQQSQDRGPSDNGTNMQIDGNHADLRQESKIEPQKVHNENAMNVVLVGAECAPWSKTGGLGDVMSALPKALSRRGHRVMAIAPRYENYEEGWETGSRIRVKVFDQEQEVGFFHGYIDGVDFVFIDHPAFHGFANNIYGGNRTDITFRCALLCKAALEAVWHVPCGGAVYGDNNLVFIANDWHTALLPVYLQAHYRDYNQMTYARSVFIIHNIAHQGRGPMDELAPLEIPEHHRELFRLYDPIGGEHMNIMKAGFITAHRIIAVSHGYAWECQTQEGGWGLDNVLRENNWKLRGIVNGMDYTEWSPSTDKFLSSDGYRHFNIDNFEEGKAACKAALQRELGLPVDPSISLLGFIGRLDYQKGVDLICESYDWLMDQGVQLIMLGSGREDLENSLRNMESGRHNQCRGWVGFSVPMAHRITAGCDILLMPSRFEPCGLNQLYAMAYGTVPVVHAVGGLRDTVKPYNPFENSGTGWTYEWSSGEGFREAVYNAIYTFKDHKKSFVDCAKRGMQQDLSWDNAAQQYEEVLLAAKYQW